MENVDYQVLRDVYDEELLLTKVICEEADLLFLDSILSSVLRPEA